MCNVLDTILKWIEQKISEIVVGDTKLLGKKSTLHILRCEMPTLKTFSIHTPLIARKKNHCW